MPIAQFQLGHGGAEMQAHRLARALIARGHEVEIISTRPAGEPRFAVVDGVPVRRLFAFGNRRGWWRLAPYSFTSLLLAELIRRRGQHDLVHAHQAFHPAWAAVLARRHFGGAPVVVKVATAGEYGDLTQMSEGRATLPVGSRRILRSILQHADTMVAISGAIEDELRAAGAQKIARIPNGVDLPPPSTPADREKSRRALDVADSAPLTVYVGRAGAQKGADLLARAWPRVAAARPDARLVLLGEGLAEVPEVAALVAARSTVSAPGRVRDVSAWLRAADLFVLPSRGEGLSNALLEAMAHGLTCLVSDLPANRELVEPGRSGLTFPVGDEAALSAAILAALSQPQAALGRRAREIVQARFTLDAVASAYEQLYHRLRQER